MGQPTKYSLQAKVASLQAKQYFSGYKRNSTSQATSETVPFSFLPESVFNIKEEHLLVHNLISFNNGIDSPFQWCTSIRGNTNKGHNEWLAEIKYLGEFYHPNLIRLCGYCIEDEERLLVYEYMPRGSLNNHLSRRGVSSSFLSWSIRMKITVGAAKGLAFLHRLDINVIHGGVQCSNILLDSEYNAKLSDFGLARDGPSDGMSHVSTRVVGTVGYGAPEYIMTGHLTAKCDVYCFGVVLLQLFSGLGALGYNMRAGEYLLHWTKPHLNSGKITHALDSYLDGQYSWESAEELANLTLKCLDNDPKLRPVMDEVVTILERLQGL